MKKFSVGVLLVLLLCMFLPASAQDEGTPVQLGNGYSITVPAGWEIRTTRWGYYELVRNLQTIRVYSPTQLQSLIILPESIATPENVLQDYATFEDLPLTTDIEPFDVPDRTAVAASYQGGKVVVVAMSDGSNGLLEASAGVFDNVLIDLIENFDGELVRGEEADLGVFAEAAVSADAPDQPREACTAYVVAADSAQLRVGPGQNRGVIAFFNPGINAPVMSRFVDDAGGLWYQLAKAAALPGSSANEIWVAAVDVTLRGDCNVVLDTDAPPIIQSSAPVVTAGGGGTTAGSDAPVVGAVPIEGNWVFALAPMSDASCLGSDNARYPTSEMWEGDTGNVYSYMDVYRGGAVLNFFSDSDFVRVEGTSNYYGTITFDDGTSTQLYLTVVNSSLLTGQMVGNNSYEGTPCSVTTQVTLRRG